MHKNLVLLAATALLVVVAHADPMTTLNAHASALHGRVMRAAAHHEHTAKYLSLLTLNKFDNAVTISQEVSADCTAAVKAASDKSAQCQFDGFKNDVGNKTFIDSVNAYCSGACPADLKNAYKAIRDKCPASYFRDAAQNERLVDVPCIKEGDKYCIADITTAFKDGGAVNGAVTVAQLNSICSACGRKVIAAIERAAPEKVEADSRVAFAALCLKDNDKYCLIELQESGFVSQTGAKEPTQDDIVKTINQICSSNCIRRYIALGHAIAIGNAKSPAERNAAIESAKQMGLIVDLLCLKNGDKTCFQAFIESQAIIASAQCLNKLPETGALPTTCDPQCKSELEKTRDAVGCCYVHLLEAAGVGDDGNAARRDYAFKTCGVTSGRCAGGGRRRITARMIIRNLKYAYASANQSTVTTAIGADVAGYVGAMSTTDVSVKIVDKAAGASGDDTVVTINIGLGSSQGDSATNALKTSAKDELAFTTLSSTTSTEARNNAAAAYTVEVSDVQSVDDSSFGLLKSIPSIFVIGASIVASVLLLA